MAELATALLPWMVGLMMAAFGATTPANAFRHVIRQPTPLLLAACVPLLVAPSAAQVIAAAFDLPPQSRAAIVLVAACPAGALTSLWVMLARGRVPQALATTLLTTALCGFTIPIHLRLAGLELDASLFGMVGKMLTLTALPLLAGVILSQLAPRVRPFAGKAKSASAVGIIALFAVLIAAAWPDVSAAWAQASNAVVALNAVLAALGLFAATMFREPEVRRALFPAFVTRQEEIGLFVALSIVGSAAMAAPLLVNALIGTGLALVFAGACRLRDQSHTKTKIVEGAE